MRQFFHDGSVCARQSDPITSLGIIDGERVQLSTELNTEGSRRNMNYYVCSLTVCLMAWLGPVSDALSEPASKSSVPIVSSHITVTSPTLVGSGPESSGLGPKDSITTAAMLPGSGQAQVMEKLSNVVSKEYIIGAEDVLEITIWRNQDLSKTVQVRPDGKVSLPIIGDVTAVGRTPAQLADEITIKLKPYVQNPAVAILIKEVNSYSIFLLGEVVRPGKYPLKSKTTLLQGITIGGGFTPIAARNLVVVFRVGENGSSEQMLKASYDDIVMRGGITQNIELKAGDTVVVPSEAMVVFPGR
jgi:polysaccharide biosynthesis/export protein